MKKRLTIIILLVFVLSLCGTIAIIYFNQEEEVSITTVRKSYSYINDSNQTQDFSVDLFISSKKSFLTKSSLGECSLQDKDQSLEIKLNSIEEKNDILRINEKEFYLYQFSFNIPLLTESDCEFSFLDASLVLGYPDNDVVIDIGSFYYLKVKDYSDYISKLTLLKVRPIVNSLNNNKTLVGLNIGFLNNYDNELTITNVKLLSSNTKIGLRESIVIEDEIQSKDNLNTILGYKYDFKDYKDEEEININLKSNEVIDYLFPIKYLNDYMTSTAGILIEYKINNQNYKYYCDETLFFQTTSIKLSESDFIINTYDIN